MTTFMCLLLIFASMSVSYAQTAADSNDAPKTADGQEKQPPAPLEFIKAMSLTDDGSQLKYQTYFGSSDKDKSVYWREGEVKTGTPDQEAALEQAGYVYVGKLRSQYKGKITEPLIIEIVSDLKGQPAGNNAATSVKSFPNSDYHQVWKDAAGRVLVWPFGSEPVFSFDSWERAQEYLQPKTGDYLRYGKPQNEADKQKYSFAGDILSVVGSAPGIFKCDEIRDQRILILPAVKNAGPPEPSSEKPQDGKVAPAAVRIAPRAILILATETYVPDEDLWRAFIGADSEWKPQKLDSNDFKRLRSLALTPQDKDVEFGKFTLSENGSIELKPKWMWDFKDSENAFSWKPTNRFQMKVISSNLPDNIAGEPLGPDELFFREKSSFEHVSAKASDEVDLHKGKYLPRRVTLSAQSAKYPLTFVRISETSDSYLLNQELTVGHVIDLLEFIEDGNNEAWRSPGEKAFAAQLVSTEKQTAAIDQATASLSKASNTLDAQQRAVIKSQSQQPAENPLSTHLSLSWAFASTLGNALVEADFDSSIAQSTKPERRAEFQYWAWMYRQIANDMKDVASQPAADSVQPTTPDEWNAQARSKLQVFQWKHRLNCLENYIAQRALMWAHHAIPPSNYNNKIPDAASRFGAEVQKSLANAIGPRFEADLNRYVARQTQLSPKTLTQVAGPHPFEEPVVLWTPRMVGEFLKAFAAAADGPSKVAVPFSAEWLTARKVVNSRGWSSDKLGVATLQALHLNRQWADFPDVTDVQNGVFNLAGNLHEFVIGAGSDKQDHFYIMGDSFRTNALRTKAVPCNDQHTSTDIGVRLALRHEKSAVPNDPPPTVTQQPSDLRDRLLQFRYGTGELPGLTNATEIKTKWESVASQYRSIAGDHVYWLDELIRAETYGDGSQHFTKAQTPHSEILETVRKEDFGK